MFLALIVDTDISFSFIYSYYHRMICYNLVLSTMVFYIIGLGLGDPEDISVKAVKAIKSCKEVYLEYYTSIMSTSNKDLE